MAMRVALFGGTFDPPHRGHMAAASAAIRQFQLDKVIFVPAAQSPHKPGTRDKEQGLGNRDWGLGSSKAKEREPGTTDSGIGTQEATPYGARKRMTELAVAGAGEPRFSVSDMESPEKTEPPNSPNYSIDTIRRYKAEHRGDEVFFMIGMDQFASFGKWRQPEQILQEARLIVATRAGWDFERAKAMLPPGIRANREWMEHIHLLDGVQVDISSTGLRAAFAGSGPETPGDKRGAEAVFAALPESVLAFIRAEGLYGAGEQLQS